jgi:hypothetical protein
LATARRVKDCDEFPWNWVCCWSILQATTREEREACGAVTAGNPNSCKPKYNIITGGEPLGNYVFESWEHGHDYRKTR